MAPIARQDKSSRTSSPGKAATVKTNPKRKDGSLSGMPAGGKKMSSLSSLQATLNFSIPKPVTTAPRISSSSTNASSSMSSTSASQDRKDMPPPPLDVVTKSKALTSANGKGKEKAKVEDEVIVVDEEDEQERINLPSSSSSDMWTERFAPVMEAELAPGKGRIAKVKNWLHTALYGYPLDYVPSGNGTSARSWDNIRKYKRILLLTGPAGAGKTTTVKVLANEMGIELVEWGEGVEESSIGGGIDRESSTSKMISFLSRHSYNPLAMSQQASSSSDTAKPRVILVTGLPNLTHLPTRDAFHAALLSFCQTFSSTSCPMVIIHSHAGSGGKAEESWMDRDRGGREGALEVVGKAVKEGPWCEEIDFIPVAPTFAGRAMNRVLALAIPEKTLHPPASAIQLIALTSNGDLRAAVNSLQMLCGHTPGETAKKRKARNGERNGGAKKKGGAGSRGGKGQRLDVSDDLRAVLDAVTRKEQSLNLFHALGKVLYNKRLGDPNEAEEDQEKLVEIRSLPPDDPLPQHMTAFERRKSLLQMETFLPTIPIDASSFALWLHQNLPSYCSQIEQYSEAVEDLCRADVMRADDDIWQSSPQAIAYALHLTVRGTSMGLPSPVPRKHQKVIKPQFFDSFRRERDNISNLDIAAGYIAKKAVVASQALSEQSLYAKQDDAAWGGVPSRLTLAVELIPMMIKLQFLSQRPLLPATVQSLALPRYSDFSVRDEELHSNEMDIDNEAEYAGGQAEEGGLSGPSHGGWDEAFGQDEKEAEEAGDAGDEIEDWD